MLRKSKAAQQRTHSKNASAKWSTARTATFWSVSVSRRFYPYRQYQKSSEVYREAVLKLRRPLANPPGHLIYSDPLSKSAAVDRQRRRSDRNRELAELRWCDRILGVRQANHEANPTGVHPGKLPQR